MNENAIQELEKKKLALMHNIKVLDEAMAIMKGENSVSPSSEVKKAGRKPLNNLIKLKEDIQNTITEKKKPLSRKSLSTLLKSSSYNIPKDEFEKRISKATSLLKKDKKLVNIGGTRNAFWYLPEWVENGKPKDEFNHKKIQEQLLISS